MTLVSPTPPVREGALELLIAGPGHWLLRDLAYPLSDARQLLASLHETTDHDVEVIWLRPDVPSRTRYRTAGEVLHDVAFLRFQSRARKPVEIPHRPPRRSPFG